MNKSILILLLAIASLSTLFAEGTREVAPNGTITVDGNTTTDIAALHLNNSNFNNFAAYDNPDVTSRLHIHISDPANEQILLGFSIGHLNGNFNNAALVDFEYRIKDPNGNIIFGPISITMMSDGPGIINSWAQGFNGPQELGNAAGYDALEVSSSDLLSQGFAGSGDYYIEFDGIDENEFLIDFWDITVVDNTNATQTEKKGRIWTNNWSFFAINDFGFPNRPFNGSFFVCAPDPADPDAAFITKIDFNDSGFQPAAFNIAFNSFGIRNTGDIASDRRSVELENATLSEYPIFLNDPVDICRTAEQGELTFEGISRCDIQDFCIKLASTKAGQVDVLLDFDGQDDVFTPNTADVLISVNIDPTEVNIPTCIDWDGIDGLGNLLQEDMTSEIPIFVTFAQGIYHFPIYDAELMFNGFDIETIRPAGPKPMLFYDDSNITSISGSGEPPVQLAGCDLPCHRWSNYTSNAITGFGNLNTINSWWFSTQTSTKDVFALPALYTCDITGNDVICDGDEALLNLDLDLLPNGSMPLDIESIIWTGPSIIGSNIGEEITIGESGTYESIITYLTALGDTCNLSCTKQIEVLTSSESQIDTTINFGEDVIINNTTYNTDGTFVQTLTATNGCDSILTIIVSVLFTEVELFCEVTGPNGLCVGETANLSLNITQSPINAPQPEITSISWTGPGIVNSNTGETITISLPGIYSATIQYLDQMGNTQSTECSIEVADNQNTFFLIDTSFFLGESATFNGETYSESGINEQVLSNAQGCDSTITIVVNVIEPLYECFITGENMICVDEIATLTASTNIIPPNSPIPPITEINWVGPGTSVTGNPIDVNQTGTYTATVFWNNAIGELRSTVCTHDLIVNEISEDSITVLLLEGDSVTINGETFREEGQFMQSLTADNGCDSLLTIDVVIEEAIITYEMEDCKSSDYSLLTATPQAELDCGMIIGGNIFRENPNVNAHSCTPGVDGGIAMCVSSLDTCDYVADSEMAIRFDILIEPDDGEEITLSGIDFFQQAPPSFEWIVGTTGRNNFPTLYGIRVLKNGVEIFREADLQTNFIWTREVFSFINNDEFTTDDTAVYSFELLPYCLIGFDAPVTAWDIDNLNVRAACSEESNRSSIAGILTDDQSRPMSDVDIRMRYGTEEAQVITSQTTTDGSYAFEYLPMNRPYEITPYYNEDHLNGVSTLDIIHIQRHILGVEYIRTPEKMIAADINNSQSITAIDIIELRKLILGIRDDFADNTSWRFSSTEQQLSMDYAWNIVEDLTTKLDERQENINFYGIKIGDVNGDVTEVTKSASLPIKLNYKVNQSTTGQQQIDFYTSENMEIAGLQMSLKNIGSMESLQSDLFDVNGHYFINDEQLTLSLNEPVLQSITAGQVLFSVVLNESQEFDSMLSEGQLNSEIYEGNDLVKRTIELYSNEVLGIDESLKAYPNPFSEETIVSFAAQGREKASFSFYNVSGRLLYSQNVKENNGLFQLKLNQSMLGVNSGIIYCIAKTGNKIENIKLLLIK